MFVVLLLLPVSRTHHHCCAPFLECDPAKPDLSSANWVDIDGGCGNELLRHYSVDCLIILTRKLNSIRIRLFTVPQLYRIGLNFVLSKRYAKAACLLMGFFRFPNMSVSMRASNGNNTKHIVAGK